MGNQFKKNCCDGIYNSFDIHFTSACDNKCAHCIDNKYEGINVSKPNVDAIVDTIVKNQYGYDDVLFLGGEPCLYLAELIDCITKIKAETALKVFVTTSVPKTLFDNYNLFLKLMALVDGINFSVQHHQEAVGDRIRCTKSQFDRQEFYRTVPDSVKNKVRINLNIVKPFLYTKQSITECIRHYDKFRFNSIKISEIQHGKEYFVRWEKIFDIDLGSPYYDGCQTVLNMQHHGIFGVKTPILLKRSCFMCEETLKATIKDGAKVVYKLLSEKPDNKYGVIYEDGTLTRGWK